MAISYVSITTKLATAWDSFRIVFVPMWTFKYYSLSQKHWFYPLPRSCTAWSFAAFNLPASCLYYQQEKFTNMWGLNKILLNNQWVKQEFKREVKIYLETNENRNTVYWKMGGLKHIILNETSQTEKNKYCMVSHMRYLKRSNS